MSSVETEIDRLVADLAVGHGLAETSTIDDVIKSTSSTETNGPTLAGALVGLGLLDAEAGEALARFARVLHGRRSMAGDSPAATAAHGVHDHDSTEAWSRLTADFALDGDGEVPEGTTEGPGGSGATGRTGSGGPRGDRYRTVGDLGRGGLGVVVRALDTLLEREVALKEIRPDLADDPRYRSRFHDEAGITGRLDHPGIVTVHDRGERAGGRSFYVMRYVPGSTLDAAIRRYHGKPPRKHESDADGAEVSATSPHEPPPPPNPGERGLEFRRLLRHFLDVCNAVDYAHSRGVLHRDLKPTNVMLGPFGETQLLDWGLAKRLGQVDGRGANSGSGSGSGSASQSPGPGGAGGGSPRTEGSGLGTPGYMSPEQATRPSHELGPAADIYSLGVTLYQILTGRPPFTAPGRNARMMLERAIRGDFPRPRAVRPEVPPALEAVCLKAMALAAGDRYPSARALADDVEHWLADEPVSVHREGRLERLARWSRRHRAWTRAGAAALAAVAVVATAAALLVNNARAAETRARNEAERHLERSQASFRLARQAVYETFTALAGDRLNAYPRMLPLRRQFAAEARLFTVYFLKAEPDDLGLKAQAVEVYRTSGRLDAQAGDMIEARRDYEQAKKLLHEMTTRDPGNERHKQQLAGVCLEYGSMMAGRGRFAEGEAQVHEGLEVTAKLIKARPGSEEPRVADARLRQELARIDVESGRAEEALAAARANAEFFRPLVERASPSPPLGYLIPLASALNREGNVLRRLGKPAEALVPLSEALGRLGGNDDNNVRLVLASCLVERGQTRAAVGDRPAAEADLSAALDLLRRLRSEYDDIVPYAVATAEALAVRGELREAVGPSRRGEAAADYRAAVEVAEALLKRNNADPPPIGYSALGRARAGLGRLATDPAERRALTSGAVENLEKAASLLRFNPDVRLALERARAQQASPPAP